MPDRRRCHRRCCVEVGLTCELLAWLVSLSASWPHLRARPLHRRLVIGEAPIDLAAINCLLIFLPRPPASPPHEKWEEREELMLVSVPPNPFSKMQVIPWHRIKLQLRRRSKTPPRKVEWREARSDVIVGRTSRANESRVDQALSARRRCKQ